MYGYLKVLAMFAIVGVVIISSLFVLDVVTSVQARDLMQKTLLVLGLVALGGLGVSFLVRPRS